MIFGTHTPSGGNVIYNKVETSKKQNTIDNKYNTGYNIRYIFQMG